MAAITTCQAGEKVVIVDSVPGEIGHHRKEAHCFDKEIRLQLLCTP